MIRTLRTLAAAALCLAGATAFAQADYPSKPVRYIVPFAPGGTTDILARIMGEHFQQAFKHPFLVENKAGAGGNIGAAEVDQVGPGWLHHPDGHAGNAGDQPVPVLQDAVQHGEGFRAGGLRRERP